MKTTHKASGTLKVGETDLYYEKRGQGTGLLLIPSASGGTRSYEPLAEYLASWYTVVTYDPRGYSRSELAPLEEVPSVQDHADDAHYLLDMLGPEPAYVFGSGAGGIVALAMFSQYTAEIKGMVVHEPTKMIDSDDEGLAGEIIKEAEFVRKYDYDLDALRASASIIPIAIIGSAAAKNTPGYRAAESAAVFFDRPMHEFPRYEQHPQEFAEQLHTLIEGMAV